MSTSFGNNKRKPGATAGAVTEAKRRATLAQNWDEYSKQPKVPSASIVPSFFGRNAGIQSMFYAQNNGFPLYNQLTYPIFSMFPAISIPAINQAPRNCIKFIKGATPNYISTPYTGSLLLPTTDQATFTIEWFQKMISVPTDGAGVPAYPRPWAIGQTAIGPLSTSIEADNRFRILWINQSNNIYSFNFVKSAPISASTLKNWCHFAIVVMPGSIAGKIHYLVF
jgi:hypothetical protein